MKKFSLVALVLLFFSGCGHYEAVVQKDDVSYALFTGHLEGAEIHIDGTRHLLLDADASAQSSPEERRFKISPGQHRIAVTKAGVVVVDRLLLFNGQTTTEIDIP